MAVAATMPAQNRPGNFDISTRRKIVQLPTLTKGTGANTQQTTLPKTGILSAIFLRISVTIAGTLSGLNAAGVSSAISRVRLVANSGIDLVNISGPGYAYLMNEVMESEYFLAQGQNQGRTAVSAATFNLDMYIPVSVNLRDILGGIMLQNEETLITLAVDFAADTSVATGATITATVKPYLVLFTVPVQRKDWPSFNVVHQWLEDQQAVPAAGQFVYQWQRGNTYLQTLHGLGIGASGSDLFTQFQVRLNQSDYLQSTDVDYLDVEHRLLRGRARPAGAALVDFLATAGTGNYGKTRDVLNSAKVTDLASVFTASGAGTLYTIRRQLVQLRPQGAAVAS